MAEGSVIEKKVGQAWSYTLVIPGTLEAEAGGLHGLRPTRATKGEEKEEEEDGKEEEGSWCAGTNRKGVKSRRVNDKQPSVLAPCPLCHILRTSQCIMT